MRSRASAAVSFSTESQRAGRDWMVVDYESMDIITIAYHLMRPLFLTVIEDGALRHARQGSNARTHHSFSFSFVGGPPAWVSAVLRPTIETGRIAFSHNPRQTAPRFLFLLLMASQYSSSGLNPRPASWTTTSAAGSVPGTSTTFGTHTSGTQGSPRYKTSTSTLLPPS